MQSLQLCGPPVHCTQIPLDPFCPLSNCRLASQVSITPGRIGVISRQLVSVAVTTWQESSPRVVQVHGVLLATCHRTPNHRLSKPSPHSQ